jgi:hypothetical protein
MYPARYGMDPLGGSHAQRDIFWMMLSDAAAKGLDPRLALSLFAERTAKKPHSAWGWQHYADCLVTVGQGGRADKAHGPGFSPEFGGKLGGRRRRWFPARPMALSGGIEMYVGGVHAWTPRQAVEYNR